MRTRFAANVPCRTCTARLKASGTRTPVYGAFCCAPIWACMARVDPPEYIRLLGLRKDAGELGTAAARAVPCAVGGPSRADAAALPDAEREKLRFETLLTDIWNCFTPVVQPAGEDYTKFPVII